MNTPPIIVDDDGGTATLEGDLPLHDAVATLRLPDGRRVDVPGSLLQPRPDGSYHLPLSFKNLAGATLTEVEERLHIGTKTRETGRVRLHRRVEVETQTVDEALLRESVEVERVPVGRFVEAAAPIRHEGDTLVVPVYEEVLVVEKKLLLREEVRVKKKQATVPHYQEVTLRHARVEVERLPPAPES